MKKSKRVWVYCFLILQSCLLFACDLDSGTRHPSQTYKHPDFITQYTQEEHIQRISERTQTRFSNEIESGEIVNYTVEIVYAFYDNDPEYFLVNLEYAEEFEKYSYGGELEYKTKYKHFLGFIEDDIYYTGINGYGGKNGDAMFIDGRNPYEVAGYANAKKYYGNFVFAVQLDNDFLQVFNMEISEKVEFFSKEEQWTQRIIPEMEYETLMKENWKYNPIRIY